MPSPSLDGGVFVVLGGRLGADFGVYDCMILFGGV